MADPGVLRVVSLFAGVGGLDLGFSAGCRDVGIHARCVGMVEGEAFGAAVLATAFEEHSLAPCPVWLGDVREFPAAAFRGAVDCVLAGFPCPPVSCAGKRLGRRDPRWLWPEVVRVVRETGAWCVALENVRGLALRDDTGWSGLDDVFGELADLGFDPEGLGLSAGEVGAPQGRDRVFVLAVRRGDGREGLGDGGAATGPTDRRRRRMARANAVADGGLDGCERDRGSGEVGDPESGARGEARERERRGDASRDHSEALALRDSEGRGEYAPSTGDRAEPARGDDALRGDAGVADRSRQRRGEARVGGPGPAGGIEPSEVGGAMADGVLSRRAVDAGALREERLAPDGGEGLADGNERGRRDAGDGARGRGRTLADGDELADRPSEGRRRPGSVAAGGRPHSEEGEDGGGHRLERLRAPLAWPPGRDDLAGWGAVVAARPDLAPRLPTQPALRRMVARPADRLDRAMSDRAHRVRAVGNVVVPAQARAAFGELWRRRR